MADMYAAQQRSVPEQVNPIARLAYAAGAVVSIALTVGMGVWGYQILVRDVSGVPVIRAAEGPIRVQPDDPGGEQALHQGLSVNEVAGSGAVSGPVEKVILAPDPLELDAAPVRSRQGAADAEADTTDGETNGVRVAADAGGANDEAAQRRAVEALADKLAEGEEPLQPLADEPPEADAVARQATGEDDVPGLGRSLRPKIRPADLTNLRTVSAVAPAGPRDVDPETIPAGTRLAQLGAFASAEVAREEWARLSNRFDEYLSSKDRVIQRAESGGRIFYRLRAMGFDDLSDARRFCSAFIAENTECIPVVTR
ncbi:SPOR domain-containing protein [Roseovarius sp. TE539]|uniref:SPOR domain-containing protein n=1 Tax=Roseovarius sp. TE539 TaxID=2249812 RepID=UPI000DE13F53|nr:SPOR domain-containing protein [Roseovarius sp. TE539]RBI77191.1 SPOR domain-containing protein [Roseovarius sp. TE539]